MTWFLIALVFALGGIWVAYTRGKKLPIVVPKDTTAPDMPTDFTFVNRLQWGLASVMAGLGTIAHFRSMSEPWIREGLYPIPAA